MDFRGLQGLSKEFQRTQGCNRVFEGIPYGLREFQRISGRFMGSQGHFRRSQADGLRGASRSIIVGCLKGVLSDLRDISRSPMGA